MIAPFTGRTMFLKEFSEPLGFRPENSLLEFGCTLGHLGAGDQMVGLREMMTKNLASSGDLIGLLGVGVGQTWSAAVLEVC
ncbi:3-oxoacyl-[acyl-carrier-protein] synthase III C-terminal domain-containing protein [Alkalilimnicola ehrlichii]|uniref:3-oxoacyl-[acyl-carrier-protein] synthase III C-terminal domain-containing protein n=1 Tax=Alkalilimnicola ehrlichii TaxID=351052 RepID=UPI0021635BFE|nr:3-oxoacyl-[acyl-carrier-protein] synthase III C-terminal domain-containing protein [Alkalilimnicola ehrlichii]